MKKAMLLLPISLLVLGGYACNSQPAAKAQTQAAKASPDNTERNMQDRSGATLTPGDQSESDADRTLTQKVRQAVVADDSLSTNAHNIKIITSNARFAVVVRLNRFVNCVRAIGHVENRTGSRH